jgi:CRP-like cAMP-binding protein
MFIERSFLFEGMGPELVEAVSEASRQQTFDEGDWVFKQGEPAGYLYILEEGRVRLMLGERGALAKTVRTPGDVFGWSSVVGPAAYTASAQCLTATRVTRIGGEKMNQLLEQDAEQGLEFYRRLAGLIRRRLLDSYRMLLSLDPEKRPQSYG